MDYGSWCHQMNEKIIAMMIAEMMDINDESIESLLLENNIVTVFTSNSEFIIEVKRNERI